MTILSDRVDISDQLPEAPQRKKKSRGSIVVSWLTSTDHKVIGYMYLMLSTFWFFAAGAMALAIRAELAIPGLQFISLEQYNQLFTYTPAHHLNQIAFCRTHTLLYKV